ncbi:Translation initiation factor IF6 [Artemisia annua]|uniref:Translation initiation factor IF6 n=1 Tax=Artemisia annua TaxID=35608 RepID=A0A2U1M2J6_ARTAN|nr:Translation initiation factor IF6 [Artemisia annua]
MASNDHVALTHTNLHKETEVRIADVLRVEIFRQKIVGVMLCSGMWTFEDAYMLAAKRETCNFVEAAPEDTNGKRDFAIVLKNT